MFEDITESQYRDNSRWIDADEIEAEVAMRY